jgi:hypothetical protein
MTVRVTELCERVLPGWRWGGGDRSRAAQKKISPFRFSKRKCIHYANGNAFRRRRARARARARLGILRPVTLSVSCVCVGEVKTGRHSTAALM